MPEYQPIAPTHELDEMVGAYLECAEWCGVDDTEEQREALELSVNPVWHPDTIAAAERICADFREAAGSLLDGIDEAQAGHDLWLTRNHHGTGFWDRGLGEVGEKLTALADPYGEAYVYFDAESETLHIDE